jgi:ribose transport system permease protein
VSDAIADDQQPGGESSSAPLEVTVAERWAPSVPKLAALITFLVIEVIVFTILSSDFLNWDNFLNILTAIAVIGIISAPGTLLIVAGQFDLSVGSMTALAGVVMASVATHHSLLLAILAAVAVGVLAGAMNGSLVTVVGVNPLITTLGTLSVLSGLAEVIAHGVSISVNGFSGLGTARPFGNIPVPVLIFVGVMVVFAIAMRYTVFGRTVYAIGANPVAARLSGIRVKRTVFVLFLLSGLACALSGLILDSQLGSSAPTAATGLELSVITAVVLGGATLSGGEGSVLGTLVGLLIVGILNNGLILLNVDPFWQDVAQGALLIAAVSFDRLRARLVEP